MLPLVPSSSPFSTAPVSAVVDIRDVEDGLDAMERRKRQLGPTFASLKAPMRTDQKDHASKRIGPDASWPPRAESTLKAHPKIPKQQLGRLPTAVSYKASGHSLVGESLVSWSLAQQEGDRVGRGAKLPERPFLWLSTSFLDLAEGRFAGAMLRAWGGD